jgi:tetratricopeptide (TPR) repeat protein
MKAFRPARPPGFTTQLACRRRVPSQYHSRCFSVLLLSFLILPANKLAAHAAQSVATDAGDVHQHLRKAFDDLKANDATSAVKEFEAVLALDPKNTDAYENLGVIAFVQRDYPKAEALLRKALAINPALVKPEALLGICEKRLGQSSAQALLEKSFPKLKEKNLRIQVGMELAGIYYQRGDLDRAASVMHTLVDLDSDNVEVLYMAQEVYSDLAEDTLNKLAILGPGSARMQQVIAQRLINSGDLQGAIEHYRKALEIDPRLAEVHYELGEAILQQAQTDPATQADAEQEFRAAQALQGDTANIECEFGRIAFLQGNMDQAYAHYQRAFALNPQDGEAQEGFGRLLAATGKPQEALKYLRMAVQTDPLNAEAHYRLATNCRKLGLTEEAAKELKLFQEIKQTKDRVRDLYRQMNKTPKESDDQIPEGQP